MHLSLPEDADLWFAFPSEIREPNLPERYRKLLSPDECARESQFRFEEDAHNFLVAHALVRTVLSRYAPVEPGDWVFATNAQGRPAIGNSLPADMRLDFNLSRTQGLVLCTVTQDAAVGADVENFRGARLDAGELAGDFYSQGEAADLSALPPQERPERFFHYWTLKEAYLKARGVGMAIPLDRTSFSLPRAGGIAFACDLAFQDGAPGWQFSLLRPTPDHIAAVCIGRAVAANGGSRVMKAVPLVSEAPFDCPVLARSAPAVS